MCSLPVSLEQKRLLGLGRVPSLRRRLLPRSHVSDQLYHSVKEFLTEPDSEWFLVCGMVGSGKSQLVTKLLWERPELCFALVDQIIWITDRHLCPADLEHLAADTLLLAASLFSAAGISEISDALSAGKSFKLSAISQTLNALLNDRMNKTLLVLDGVLMAETVQFFDQIKGPKCKILATSSSRTLFEGLESVHTFTVPPDGCTGDELSRMALSHGIEVDKFSHERINSILYRTGGNFALLEKMFIMARGNLAIFDSLLAQLKRAPLSLVSCHSAYHSLNLERPLRKCFAMLDDALSRSFDFCTVIEPFQWTNFEILSLIWPLDVCGSESKGELRAIIGRQLDTLEANCLLDKCAEEEEAASFSESDHFSVFRYRLHPMVHNFLQHSRPNAFATFKVVFGFQNSFVLGRFVNPPLCASL